MSERKADPYAPPKAALVPPPPWERNQRRAQAAWPLWVEHQRTSFALDGPQLVLLDPRGEERARLRNRGWLGRDLCCDLSRRAGGSDPRGGDPFPEVPLDGTRVRFEEPAWWSQRPTPVRALEASGRERARISRRSLAAGPLDARLRALLGLSWRGASAGVRVSLEARLYARAQPGWAPVLGGGRLEGRVAYELRSGGRVFLVGSWESSVRLRVDRLEVPLPSEVEGLGLLALLYALGVRYL